MPSITSGQTHSPKQNKRTLTPTTPPQTPGQPAGHESLPQGPVHMGCTVLHATTLGLSPQAQEALTSDLELKPHPSYIQDENLQAPWVVLKLVPSSFPYSTQGKWQQLWWVGAATRIPQQRKERSVWRTRRKLWRNRRGYSTNHLQHNLRGKKKTPSNNGAKRRNGSEEDDDEKRPGAEEWRRLFQATKKDLPSLFILKTHLKFRI